LVFVKLLDFQSSSKIDLGSISSLNNNVKI